MRFEFGAVPGDRGLDLCCCGAPGAHADREASARSPSRRVGFPGCDPRVRVSVCTCPLCPAAFAGLARLRGACGSQCWCECTAARLPSGAWPAWRRGPVRRGGAGVPGGASAVSAYRRLPGRHWQHSRHCTSGRHWTLPLWGGGRSSGWACRGEFIGQHFL